MALFAAKICGFALAGTGSRAGVCLDAKTFIVKTPTTTKKTTL